MLRRLWRHANHITVRWAGIALIAVVMLSLFAWGMADNRSALRELSEQEITLNQALYTRNQQRARLEAAVNQVGTKSYVEREARSSLGYLKSGEIRFRVVNPEALSMYTEEENQILLDQMRLDIEDAE